MGGVIRSKDVSDVTPLPTLGSGSKFAATGGILTIEAFVGSAMDNARMGAVHYHVLSLLSAGYFIDIVDGITLGSLAPDLIRGGFATPIQIASVASATLIGQFIGAVGQGELGDRYGRKAIYQLNLLLFALTTIAGALAPNLFWLAVFRCLAGIGLGAELPMANAYAAEYAPKAIRGRFMAAMQLFGGAMAWPIGTLFVLAFHNSLGWRGVWIAVGGFALAVWAVRYSMPESPRWLVAHGQGMRALEVLKHIGLGASAPEVYRARETTQAQRKDPLVIVLERYRTRLVAGMICFTAFIGVTYGLAVWLPKMMADRGLTITQSLTYTFLMTLAFPCASIALLFTLERFGRRLSSIASFVLAGLSAVGFVNSHVDAMLMVTGFCMIFFLQTAGNSMVIIVAEVFPTSARATGFGLAQGVGRLGSALIVPAFLWIQTGLGINAVFASIAGVMVIAAAGVFLLGPETRGVSLDSLAPPAG